MDKIKTFESWNSTNLNPANRTSITKNWIILRLIFRSLEWNIPQSLFNLLSAEGLCFEVRTRRRILPVAQLKSDENLWVTNSEPIWEQYSFGDTSDPRSILVAAFFWRSAAYRWPLSWEAHYQIFIVVKFTKALQWLTDQLQLISNVIWAFTVGQDDSR